MQPADPLVVGGRVQVEVEICDGYGNTTEDTDQFLGRGEGPFQHERWQYAALPPGRGMHWQLVLTDLDPPRRFPTGAGFVYTHNPIACHVHVDGVCTGSTPLFYEGHDVEVLRGKRVAGVLHKFTFAVTNFADAEASGALDGLEKEIATAGCIEVTVNEYEAVDRGTRVQTVSVGSATPKQRVVPETEKTREIKVSTQFQADPGAAAAAAAMSGGVEMVSRVNINFLKRLAQGHLRYRDRRIIEKRNAKRARTASDAAAGGAAGAAAAGAGAAGAGGAAGAVAAPGGVKQEEDTDEVEEFEVIDLTTETIDLTKD